VVISGLPDENRRLSRFRAFDTVSVKAEDPFRMHVVNPLVGFDEAATEPKHRFPMKMLMSSVERFEIKRRLRTSKGGMSKLRQDGVAWTGEWRGLAG